MFQTLEEEKAKIEKLIDTEICEEVKLKKSISNFDTVEMESKKRLYPILAGCKYHIVTFPNFDTIISSLLGGDLTVNGISNAIGDGNINIMHNLLVKYSESGYPSESVPTSIVIEYRMKLRGYVLNEKTALFERPKFSEPSPINSVANQGQ